MAKRVVVIAAVVIGRYYFVRRALHIDAMRSAAGLFIGEHDFR
jgi:tRNA U38,U39,U40 pseudouridine synthase TruA